MIAIHPLDGRVQENRDRFSGSVEEWELGLGGHHVEGVSTLAKRPLQIPGFRLTLAQIRSDVVQTSLQGLGNVFADLVQGGIALLASPASKITAGI